MCDNGDNGLQAKASPGSIERLWQWLWKDRHYMGVFAPVSAAALILARIPGAIPGGARGPVGVLVGVVFIASSAAELLPSVNPRLPWGFRGILTVALLASIVYLVVSGAFYA